jgi:CTP synthase
VCAQTGLMSEKGSAVQIPTAPLGKYVVVTGGTVSGLGKGTAISSLGAVLRMHGIRLTSLKIDPYLNVDAGTMSPFEHGEVYVLEDGAEADLDLGNYERFLDVTLGQNHNITSGKIFDQVIKRERTGEYLGKTVQLIPHVSDAIQDWIANVAAVGVDGSPGQPDLCLIELGGTVSDVENGVYLEALQQFMYRVGPENFVMMHVGMVPVMGVVGEQKTKPTQQSVKKLREAGLRPDFLFCRCETPLEDATRKKLSLFCQTPVDHVISLHDVSNIYRVPLLLHQQGLGVSVCKRLNLPFRELDPSVPRELGNPMSMQSIVDWKSMADRVDMLTEEIVIGIVGKYTGLQDSYLSVLKSLKHASIEAGLHLVIEWIESTDLEPNMRSQDPSKYDSAWRRLKMVNGILCPGGFGDRGIEGKALCAKYCRESNTPYFGICLGLQTAVIDYARSELGWDDANSTEFNENTKHPVVMFMPEVSASQMGGTMRLGNRVTIIKDPDSLAGKIYNRQPVVYERHRHRYEVNPQMVAALESKGLKFSGQDERGQRMEIIEIPGHPFFLATQFHPEFRSRPMVPSPPFLGFVLASGGKLKERLESDGGGLKIGSGWDRDILP